MCVRQCNIGLLLVAVINNIQVLKVTLLFDMLACKMQLCALLKANSGNVGSALMPHSCALVCQSMGDWQNNCREACPSYCCINIQQEL